MNNQAFNSTADGFILKYSSLYVARRGDWGGFTEILGLKKLQDASYGSGSRWLVVAPPEQSDFGIVLQKPRPEEHGAERARMKMEQIGKGTTWVFRVDNLDETFQILSDRGVKFLSPLNLENS